MKPTTQNRGFTILELCIFIFLFAIVSGVVYTVFNTTQNTYAYNSKTVDLRQNLRASVDFMTGSLMSAGNPGFNRDILEMGSAETGFLMAARDILVFTTDLDYDNILSQVAFGLSPGSDANGDGLADTASGTAALVRETASGFTFSGVIGSGAVDTISDDIQAIQFAYAVDTNGDDAVDFTDIDGDGQADSNEVIWAYDSDNDQALDTDINGNALASNISINKIIMVKIWILGRTSSTLKIPIDTRTYQMGALTVSGGNDTYKRFLLSTTVKCRNMGL